MRIALCRISVMMAVALASTLPAFAGYEEKPCEEDAQKCVEGMIEKLSGRGWVGIEMDRAEEGHWILTNVVPRSPAYKAGLKKGDELLALNGIGFAEKSEALKKAHAGMKPDTDIVYTVRRDGKESEVTVTLGRLPKALLAQWIGYHMLEGHAGEAAYKLVDEDK